MKAFTRKKYGGPEVLKLEEVEKPTPKDNELLIRVKANSVNPADWHVLRGEPVLARFAFGLFKPKNTIPGTDFSGIVEQTGKDVTQFQVGDHVFGEHINGGVFAEYSCVPEGVCAKMLKGADFATMACLPVAGVTALQSLTTHGNVKKGERLLINGSTGGVGHFTVQMARSMGTTVTAVCSSSNADFAKELGADFVIAYDEEDIHQHKGDYDLVIDNHGNLNLNDFVKTGRRGVIVGFTSLGHMLGVNLRNIAGKIPLKQFTANVNTKDLNTLAEMIAEGTLKVNIEKTYPYQQLPDAISYIEKMHTRGKVAVVWE